jgi:serine/threonine protein kinase
MTRLIQTEIKISRQLDHPHIIKLLDTFTTTPRGERPLPFPMAST